MFSLIKQGPHTVGSGSLEFQVAGLSKHSTSLCVSAWCDIFTVIMCRLGYSELKTELSDYLKKFADNGKVCLSCSETLTF